MTFEQSLWYARGQVDAMNGLGILDEIDAELFASHMLNIHGVTMPHHTDVRAAWLAWATTRQDEKRMERTN